MQSIENGATIEEAVKIFEDSKNNYSGAPEVLIKNIVFNFSNKGPEFYEATSYGLSAKDKEIIESKKHENNMYAQEIYINKISGKHM